MREEQKSWAPLSVRALVDVFAGADFSWWVAGGIALELALGREIRPHGDIDVLVLRRDHARVRAFLADWDCWAADPPGTLRPWPVGERLDSSVHDVWCRRVPANSWQLQLLLDEAEGDTWVSRRDPRVRASLAAISRVSATGVPYLAPQVLLFYKAKSLRDKDHVDFEAILNAGAELDRVWLQQAIVSAYGVAHPWLERLRG